MVMPMNGEMPVAVGIPGMKDDGSPGFDWDQWDAVFGHYVPVDDFMELDSGGTWSLGAWDGTSLGWEFLVDEYERDMVRIYDIMLAI
jgi:hypothetical protein